MIYPDLPVLDIKETEEYKVELESILADFNKRGSKPSEVRDMIEGFLDNVKEGWGSKIKKIKKALGQEE
jgi:hypothetical protein